MVSHKLKPNMGYCTSCRSSCVIQNAKVIHRLNKRTKKYTILLQGTCKAGHKVCRFCKKNTPGTFSRIVGVRKTTPRKGLIGGNCGMKGGAKRRVGGGLLEAGLLGAAAGAGYDLASHAYHRVVPKKGKQAGGFGLLEAGVAGAGALLGKKAAHAGIKKLVGGRRVSHTTAMRRVKAAVKSRAKRS